MKKLTNNELYFLALRQILLNQAELLVAGGSGGGCMLANRSRALAEKIMGHISHEDEEKIPEERHG